MELRQFRLSPRLIPAMIGNLPVSALPKIDVQFLA